MYVVTKRYKFILDSYMLDVNRMPVHVDNFIAPAAGMEDL